MPDLLASIQNLIQTHTLELWMGTGVLLLSLLLGLLAQSVRLNRLKAHYQTLLEGVDGSQLEELLTQHMANVAQAQGEMKRNQQRIQELTQHEHHCFQNLGFVRYDAFEDVGGQQSFAMALLDAHKNGLVLSGLVGRQETRVFAKHIQEGTCTQFLTEEEQKAIEAAKQSNYVPSSSG